MTPFVGINGRFGAYMDSMDHLVVIRGKGRENQNIVVKKKRKRSDPFVLFLLLFGAAVYLISTVFFKSMFGEFVPITAFSVAF